MRRLLLVVLLFGCAHAKPCIETNFCPDTILSAQATDPEALRAIVIDARTRRFPAECWSCEEGTACASCDRLMVLALRHLGDLRTDDAARAAAALVVDERLQWDGGASLILGKEVTRMGAIVLPHLRPHVERSAAAKRIVGCIERGEPCY